MDSAIVSQTLTVTLADSRTVTIVIEPLHVEIYLETNEPEPETDNGLETEPAAVSIERLALNAVSIGFGINEPEPETETPIQGLTPFNACK